MASNYARYKAGDRVVLRANHSFPEEYATILAEHLDPITGQVWGYDVEATGMTPEGARSEQARTRMHTIQYPCLYNGQEPESMYRRGAP